MSLPDYQFCAYCGSRVHLAVPAGDDRERFICPDCHEIHYINPKIIVGSVVYWDQQILLCRRAIEPRQGFWTIPAGFMELGETAEEGAIREAYEEARAAIKIEALLATYSVRHVGQVQLIYLASLREKTIEAGVESLEVSLFSFDEIPWHEIAFPTVEWALRRANLVRRQSGPILPESNPAGAEPIRGGA